MTLVVFSGCGYHFSGEGQGPRPGLKSVAIPVFENATSEPDLGSMFAGALRKEFIQKGPIRVAPMDQAEAIFRGKIKNVYTSSVAHHDALRTIETRLYVTLEIRCVDARKGSVIWQDLNLTYYKVYMENPEPILAFDNRRETLEFLAREMSIRVHDRFLSNF